MTWYSLPNTDGEQIGMKTSQAPERIVAVGWPCSLHHLPAFVIVPYYCPCFSSALSELSPALFSSSTTPGLTLLCERLDQSASDWMADCAGVALRLSSAIRCFPGLRRRRRARGWIDAFSNHAWMKDVFWNKLATDWGWTLKKTFPDTSVRSVPFTILFDCIYHWNIHKTLRLNHCSESRTESVFLPPYFHRVICAAPAVSAVLQRITSCTLTSVLSHGENFSRIQSRPPISQLRQHVFGGRCCSNATFADAGVMK